jgi:RNA polymerase sigma factor (sigma-70 family)
MVEEETILFERVVVHGDSKALNVLVRRYAHMVYATALRIVQNDTHATEVTRQTFLELTCHGESIPKSTGSWLHQVATEKAIDFHRPSVHAKSHEQTTFQTHSGSGRTWQDLAGYIDEALEELDAPAKTLLIDHFLIGKTTAQISKETGVSPEDVACRLNDGLDQLHGILKRGGLLFTETVLHAMLTENTRQAASERLLMELAKIKLVGSGLEVKGMSGSRPVLYTKNHLYKNALIASIVVGAVAIAGFMYRSRSLHLSHARVIAAQTQSREQAPKATTAKPQPTFVKPVLLSDPVDRAIRTNWATPENAVRSLMTLLEQQAVDELKQGLAQGAEDILDSPYLKCLAGPIEIIEVIQEESTAQVNYLAAVRTEFTLNNTTWLPGDALTLSARLLWVNDLWKCSAINSTSFEGDTDDAEQNTL